MEYVVDALVQLVNSICVYMDVSEEILVEVDLLRLVFGLTLAEVSLEHPVRRLLLDVGRVLAHKDLELVQG